MDGGVWGLSGPLLHCALPCSPGISLFHLHTFSCLYLFLSLSDERTCLCVQHAYSLHVNGNPGNLLTSPSRHFWWSLMSIAAVIPSHLSHLFPAHPSRPLVSFMCSAHLNQFRAHTCSQFLFQSAIMYTHHNPLLCRNPANCVLSLLLSDAPFTDRAVFSIQGQLINHIFTVIHKTLTCWEPFFFSRSQLTNLLFRVKQALSSSSSELPLMVVRGWVNDNNRGSIRHSTSLTTAVTLHQVDFEQWLDWNSTTPAFAAARLRRLGKRRQAEGLWRQPECCERGVCCSFMMCEKCILFALHLFQRKCVCVLRRLDRLCPLTQNEILFVGRCSGSTLCSH